MQLHKGLAIDALLKIPAIRKNIVDIQRGIERETLRITPEGKLATTMHPVEQLGETVAHPTITTDYSESLLEFITPPSKSVPDTLAQLKDLHRLTYAAIGEELLWPLSMPCYVNQPEDIRIAYYGTSHSGKMKSIYRQGLTYRYGAVMQTIAGVHYNFSVSEGLWDALAEEDGDRNNSEYRSSRYLGLIRNFKRYAWVVLYFFGASPALCKTFLKHSPVSMKLDELGGGLSGFKYGTSLRMSDLGYTNKEQSELGVTYNSLEEYVNALRHAVFTPAERFEKIGVQVDGAWRQLSPNILQIENEFYAPIRPKQIPLAGETPTQALERAGIEYIEARLLDVNPFSSVGISAEQMYFMDLLLLFCLLEHSPELSWEAQLDTESFVTEIIRRGRKPGLLLTDITGIASVKERLTALFSELLPIAVTLDEAQDTPVYQTCLEHLTLAIENPEQTLSGQLMAIYNQAIEKGGNPGMALAQQYRAELIGTELEFYTQAQADEWTQASIAARAQLEAESEGSFKDFLEAYFTQAKIKKMRSDVER